MADFTIADVLAWARTKPADERYCYNDNGRCAIAQFLLATGRSHDPNVGSTFWHTLEDDTMHPIAPELDAAVEADRLSASHTFGALVKRLEALTPAESVSATWTQRDAYLTDIEQVSPTIAGVCADIQARQDERTDRILKGEVL